MASNADYAAIGSRTLMDQGLAKARGQEISGQLWGETISRLGDLVPKQVRQTMQEAAQRRAHATMMQIFQDAGGDLEKALPQISQIDPVFALELGEMVGKSKTAAFEMKKAEWEYKNLQADWAKRTLIDANNQQEWTAALHTVREAGQPIDKYQTEWTPELKQQLMQNYLSYKEQLELSKPKDPAVDLQETVNEQGQRVRRAVLRTPGTETLMPPETPETPEQIFVTRGGVPTPIAKGTAQPGDVPYQPPSQAQPDFEWVIRAGKPKQIRKGTSQPGDVPYEKPTGGAGQPEPPSQYQVEGSERTIQSVNALIGRVNNWTAGVGSSLASLPATDARDFAAQLNTLKSNIAFNELAQMRAASKTGGGLGAISERELTLLESSLGALDQGQSPANLKKQLTQIKESLERWREANQLPPVDPRRIPSFTVKPRVNPY